MSDTPADNTTQTTQTAENTGTENTGTENTGAEQTSTSTSTSTEAKPKKGESKAAKAAKDNREWIVAVHGRMLHLHTNVWFDADPKRHELDDFVKAQLEAGKLAIYTE